jgi:hypothetical protein
MEAEYARDLGFAAVRHLIEGGGGAVVTTQAGAPRFVPLADGVDPATGRGRQRAVDVASANYQVAPACCMTAWNRRTSPTTPWWPGWPAPEGSLPTRLRRHFARLDLQLSPQR